MDPQTIAHSKEMSLMSFHGCVFIAQVVTCFIVSKANLGKGKVSSIKNKLLPRSRLVFNRRTYEPDPRIDDDGV